MDLRMPQLGGVEAINTICAEFKPARIIVLTTYDGDEDIYRGLHSGAQGYLLKDAKPNELERDSHSSPRSAIYSARCRRKTGAAIE